MEVAESGGPRPGDAKRKVAERRTRVGSGSGASGFGRGKLRLLHHFSFTVGERCEVGPMTARKVKGCSISGKELHSGSMALMCESKRAKRQIWGRLQPFASEIKIGGGIGRGHRSCPMNLNCISPFRSSLLQINTAALCSLLPVLYSFNL